jgi:hypothetical protein
MENQNPIGEFSIRRLGDAIPIDEVAKCFYFPWKGVRKFTHVNGVDNEGEFVPGEKLFGYYDGKNHLLITKESIRDYLSFHSTRDPLKDKILINSAKTQLALFGINSLGPLHQNREAILKFLKNGGDLKVLILNKDSADFKLREDFEERPNKPKSGRLAAEFDASKAICQDIKNFSEGAGKITLKLYSQPPIMSLVMIDYENKNDGIINQNLYPKIPGTRGLSGRQLRFEYCKDPYHFEQLVKYYFNLWSLDSTVTVNLQ